MVPVLSLWLPILLAAVIVFVASSIVHMVLPFHKSDYARLPKEDEVMAALRGFAIPPAEYFVPLATSSKEMGTAAFKEKMAKGPILFMTVRPNGMPSMTSNFIGWFVYCLVVGIFAAYISGRALQPGAHYLQVFRFAGCTAFIGYSLALWQNTIWYSRNWVTTLKSTVDGLVYGLLTAGVFGWLWPR
jgi:hypothetical protein